MCEKVTIEVFENGEATFSVRTRAGFQPMFFESVEEAEAEAKVQFGESVEITVNELFN